MKPAEIIDTVKASICVRGGAGFSLRCKSGLHQYDDGKPHYIVVNGDESEPALQGSYDSALDPHQLIEGLVISAFATTPHLCYIYIRCEFPDAARIGVGCQSKAKQGLGARISSERFDCDIYGPSGRGRHTFAARKTSLLESLEGKRPYPRIKPPYFPRCSAST